MQCTKIQSVTLQNMVDSAVAEQFIIGYGQEKRNTNPTYTERNMGINMENLIKIRDVTARYDLSARTLR